MLHEQEENPLNTDLPLRCRGARWQPMDRTRAHTDRSQFRGGTQVVQPAERELGPTKLTQRQQCLSRIDWNGTSHTNMSRCAQNDHAEHCTWCLGHRSIGVVPLVFASLPTPLIPAVPRVSLLRSLGRSGSFFLILQPLSSYVAPRLCTVH